MKINSPSKLFIERMNVIEKKKQGIDKEFQEFWNQEANWENKAKIMEFLGRYRELKSELEFLEILKEIVS